jgi:hypothetical protein
MCSKSQTRLVGFCRSIDPPCVFDLSYRPDRSRSSYRRVIGYFSGTSRPPAVSSDHFRNDMVPPNVMRLAALVTVTSLMFWGLGISSRVLRR